MNQLKVAIIGIGNMGKNHLRVFRDIDMVKVVAFSDVNSESRKYYSQKYHLNNYGDYKELYYNEKPDIVSIVTPTKTHYKIAKFFIENKIHVLIEKPITNNVEQAKELIELAKKNEVKFTIGHIERFNPAIIELKKKIQDNELGKIFKIDINRIGPYPRQITDVGVCEDLAVHDVDIMRYILECEPKRLFAELGYKIKCDNEDLLSGLIRFDNNTICNLNINWLTPTKIRKLYITGEKGMFVVDYLLQKLIFYENDYHKNLNNEDETSVFSIKEGKMIRYNINKKEPLKLEVEHFIDCIINDKTPLVSGKDGLKAVEIAQNLIKSYKTHSAISFNENG